MLSVSKVLAAVFMTALLAACAGGGAIQTLPHTNSAAPVIPAPAPGLGNGTVTQSLHHAYAHVQRSH